MKVLQIGKFYPPHWGGMETALMDISETIASQVDVEVLVANSRPRRRAELCNGIRVTRLANWSTVCSQPITPGLLGELRTARADIVHLHEPNPLALALFLASGNPARLIIHYHSDIVRQRRLARLYRPILERGLARAEAIIVGSQELRDQSAVLRNWRHKCVVVPFGIALDPFLIMPVPRPGPQAPVKILAVGRLSYYKGFHHLIDASARLNAHVTIAGGGELHGSLSAQIDRLKLRGRVTLAGKVTQEELLALYAGSDIFCLPSCEPSEAFGLAMVEGMAAGLPVVSTNLPTGVRLVNQHGSTGLVVEPGDVDALAAALDRLIRDGSLRAQFGSAGRERAQQLFAREVMGETIVSLYQSAVSGGPRGNR